VNYVRTLYEAVERTENTGDTLLIMTRHSLNGGSELQMTVWTRVTYIKLASLIMKSCSGRQLCC